MADWLQITLQTTQNQAEAIADGLEAIGAAAVTLCDAADQPLLEPEPGTMPLWADLRITGLFASDAEAAELLTLLAAEPGCEPLPPYQLEHLENQAWERVWLNRFEPMQFGQRLWICPSGYRVDAADAVVVKLDPGLAFGTGTHETTRLCLEWLDAHPPCGEAVLDFGCGSGVLGIAAALLGAQTVTALDIDPQALTATRANAGANDCAARITTVLPAAYEPRRVDTLVANILSGPLVELADTLLASLGPGGRLVLSGVLETQAETVMAAYRPRVDFAPPTTLNGWVRLDGRVVAENTA